MKKRLIPLLLTLALLTACAPAPAAPAEEEGTLHVLATTYPIYLFAAAVTDGVAGISLSRLNTGEQSCLHDYTLSVTDMKAVEGADLIAMNGLELEEFLTDALSRSTAAVVDCSAQVQPLEGAGHDHEEGAADDHGHFDPHIWMDPRLAAQMVAELSAALCQLDPASADQYQSNAQAAQALLLDRDQELRALLCDDPLTAPAQRELITFHDGFQYFAKAYDFTILRSIEEEEGSTASAKEIVELVALVQSHALPAIFTEVNGTQATAQAIARETGARVEALSMIMDGEGDSLSAYLDAQMDNALTILRGFSGQEVTIHP